MTEIFALSIKSRTFVAIPNFRWLRPSGTTTKPDRLQQAYRCIETDEIDWVDVPVVVEPSHD